MDGCFCCQNSAMKGSVSNKRGCRNVTASQNGYDDTIFCHLKFSTFGNTNCIMKKLFLPALVLLSFFLVSAGSHSSTSAAIKEQDTPRMKQYWLATLHKGHNRTHDKETAARIQAAHIANIDRLAQEGYIVMAGPMGYDRDIRGIFIMDAKDSVTAASLIKTDSAVITGRLRFELHPWWTQTGTYIFK
jgi:uncharacterized protein YciI